MFLFKNIQVEQSYFFMSQPGSYSHFSSGKEKIKDLIQLSPCWRFSLAPPLPLPLSAFPVFLNSPCNAFQRLPRYPQLRVSWWEHLARNEWWCAVTHPLSTSGGHGRGWGTLPSVKASARKEDFVIYGWIYWKYPNPTGYIKGLSRQQEKCL